MHANALLLVLVCFAETSFGTIEWRFACALESRVVVL